MEQGYKLSVTTTHDNYLNCQINSKSIKMKENEERMNDETLSEARRNTAKYKYETAVQNINDLQEKL